MRRHPLHEVQPVTGRLSRRRGWSQTHWNALVLVNQKCRRAPTRAARSNLLVIDAYVTLIAVSFFSSSAGACSKSTRTFSRPAFSVSDYRLTRTYSLTAMAMTHRDQHGDSLDLPRPHPPEDPVLVFDKMLHRTQHVNCDEHQEHPCDDRMGIENQLFQGVVPFRPGW